MMHNKLCVSVLLSSQQKRKFSLSLRKIHFLRILKSPENKIFLGIPPKTSLFIDYMNFISFKCLGL